MIIVLKNNDQNTIAELQEHFGNTHEVFVHNNRVAVQGIKEADLSASERAAATDIITNVPKAVQGSREFHPEDTVIRTKHSVIGGDNFTMMAGPCSVESEEHIAKMAAVAKANGATILRGGASSHEPHHTHSKG